MISEIYIPAAVVSVIISSAISYMIAKSNQKASLKDLKLKNKSEIKSLKRKIESELHIANANILLQNELSIRAKAWEDYSIRRDCYFELSQYFDSLYENGNADNRPLFHLAARKVRLVGSDKVVGALNAFTNEIKTIGTGTQGTFRELCNAMRRDIRTIYSNPQEGTDLGPEAFPIEY